MNKDVLQGRWNMVKGKLKEKWGKLTDQDITRIEGKAEQLYGLLQEKYGINREACRKQVSEFIENLDKTQFETHWNEIRTHLREKFNQLSNEDISRLKGKRDEFITLLQNRYNINREKAMEQLNAFVESLHITEKAGAGKMRK